MGKKDDIIQLAGQIIKEKFWNSRATMWGRTWSPVSRQSVFKGSNVLTATENEMVSISRTKDGKLVIHHFVRADSTQLGEEIKKVLAESGLM